MGIAFHFLRVLEKNEVKILLTKCNIQMSPTEIDRLFKSIDIHPDGLIQFDELVKYLQTYS